LATTATVEGKTEYQKYTMRIVRSTDERKQVLRDLLHEVLRLHFTLEKYKRDYNYSASKPVGVAPNFKLAPDTLSFVHAKIAASPLGQPNVLVATYVVSVPKENRLNQLIPFYQDIAVEFWGKFKNAGISLSMVECATKTFQRLKIKGLEDLQEFYEKSIGDLVYLRIAQERDKAYRVMYESFNLNRDKFALKLTEYRKNDENRSALYLLCMNKMRREGFGYFESNLAACQLIFPSESYPSEVGVAAPLWITTHESLASSGLNSFDDPRLVEWRESADSIDLSRCELVFNRHREKELVELRASVVIQKATREWLIQFIEDGGTRDQMLVECGKRGYSHAECRRVFYTYEGLVKEGCKEVNRFISTIILKDDDLDVNATLESVYHSHSDDISQEERRNEKIN